MVSFPRSKQNKMPYVYKCSWFESRRHRRSHTSMYFERAEDTEWVFERCWGSEVCRVEYIQVSEDSQEYDCAKSTTEARLRMEALEEHKLKMKDIVKELDDITRVSLVDNEDYKLSWCAICDCVLPHMYDRRNKRYLSYMGHNLCKDCDEAKQVMLGDNEEESDDDNYDDTRLTLSRVEGDLSNMIREHPSVWSTHFCYNHELCRACGNYYPNEAMSHNKFLCIPCLGEAGLL